MHPLPWMGIEKLWIEIEIGKNIALAIASNTYWTTIFSNGSVAIWFYELEIYLIKTPKKTAGSRFNLLRPGKIGSWVCFWQTRAISSNAHSFQSFTLLEEDKYWKCASLPFNLGQCDVCNIWRRWENISLQIPRGWTGASLSIVRSISSQKGVFPGSLHLRQHNERSLCKWRWETKRVHIARNGTYLLLNTQTLQRIFQKYLVVELSIGTIC